MESNPKYLDMAGLQVYDGLIKGIISDENAKSFKSFQYDQTTRTLKFFKVENPEPESTPDFSMVLPEQDLSGFLEKIETGVKDNIVIIGENGIVVDSGIAVSKIATKSEVKVNTDAIAILNGTGEGSVNKKVADAVAAILADAPEAYDTLKEISDWISSHSSDAASMNSQINTNKSDITTLKTLIGELPEGASSNTVMEYILEIIGTAKSEVKTYADGLNTTMNERMDAVEKKVGEGFEAISNEEINALFKL